MKLINIGKVLQLEDFQFVLLHELVKYLRAIFEENSAHRINCFISFDCRTNRIEKEYLNRLNSIINISYR